MTSPTSAPNETSTAAANRRRAVLDRLRTRVIEGPDLPALDAERLIQYADPVEAFCHTARSVGAACHCVDSPADVEATLRKEAAFRDARRIASLVPEAVAGNTDLRLYDDPHFLKGLDWFVARGEFGVAENGAIWADMDGVAHRASFFITQYLVLVLRREDIVPHMHAAYQRLGDRVRQSFGVFIAGPSKTADIEQSLVIGAHGCRALHIFLVGEDH